MNLKLLSLMSSAVLHACLAPYSTGEQEEEPTGRDGLLFNKDQIASPRRRYRVCLNPDEEKEVERARERQRDMKRERERERKKEKETLQPS